MKTLLLVLLCAPLAFAGDGDNPPVKSNDDTFTFQDGDRRDPFTFAKRIPKVIDHVTPVKPDEENQPGRMDPAQVAAKKAEMLSLNFQAENFLMEAHPAESIQCCERALDCIKDVHVSDYRELQIARDTVLRQLKASTRAKRRDDAERDFAILNLHLTGVVISDKLPRAIINGKVVGAGDMVGTQDGDRVQIAHIEHDRVVVFYGPYRMPVNLEQK